MLPFQRFVLVAGQSVIDQMFQSAKPLYSFEPPQPPLIKGGLYRYLIMGGICQPFVLMMIVGLSGEAAVAQITPDATLPNPTVTTSEGQVIRIEGGTQAGNNLFHSFQDFSVNPGFTAFFNNSVEIQNIISRVTGGNLSNIDGIIQANGTANLFLLNPNGIIFGPNAQLNIGGSFIASTANRLLFDDSTEFSATPTTASPLLTVNVPIGLQVGANSGGIVNRSQAVSLGLDGKEAIAGLQVPYGQNLALVGGSINLEGGYLTAPDGQIQLVSIQNGTWQLPNSNFRPLTPGNAQLQPIQLSQTSQVNTTGLGGGSIKVLGGDVSLTEGSRLLANTAGSLNGGGIHIQAENFSLQNRAFVSASTVGEGTSGGITLEATQSVVLTGSEPLKIIDQLVGETFDPLNPEEGLYSLSAGQGNAGNIAIATNELIVNNGAGVLTPALGTGQGGNLTVHATQRIEVSDGSLLISATNGLGDAGDVLITTPQLQLLNDGFIVSSPGRSGVGKGGNLTVNADVMELRGVSEKVVVPGGLFTTTLGKGDAGDLTVNTRQLTVADGMQVSASATGAGKGGNLTVNAESIELRGLSADNRFLSGLFTSSSLLTVQGQIGSAPAGDLTVNTGRLVVADGAQISAATGGEGSAGNLRLNASESIEVVGFATNVDPGVESVSFGVVGDGIVPSAIESNTSGAGSAGDLRIQTNRLTVRDGAEVGVRGIEDGAAGNLDVNANAILLENEGTISAATVAGTGGNITLNAQTVELREGSQITTNAGNADGGNITINADNLIALENSDITANAQQGKGGQVTINAQGIFGTQFRENETPASDITATSELGAAFSGIVEINSPEVDPSAALVELPSEIVDPTTLIVSGCASYAGSEFVITGRGGLPATPYDPLNGNTLVVNWIDLQSPNSLTSRQQNQRVITTDKTPQQNDVIVEAQGWIIKPNGEVELVTRPPSANPHSPGISAPNCKQYPNPS